MGRLEGKVALITGAGSGVGRACMEIFSREGAAVVGVGRTQSSLDQTLAPIIARGDRGSVVVADLSSDDGADGVVAHTLAEFGKIDILVHAAAVGASWEERSPGSMQAIDQTAPAKWREVIGLNLDAAYLMSRAVLAPMRKQGGGSIVLLGSTGSFRGMGYAHAYGAAKAGVVSLVQSMAVTYADDKIRANCVVPGAIDTPMIADQIGAFNDPKVARILCPTARPSTPDEVAYACLFFASFEGGNCTGSVLVVDGGSLAQFATPNSAE